MTNSDQGIVQVDGSVLLQLIRHHQEYLSSDRENIGGFLLGITTGNTIEITNSIPYPPCSDDDQIEGYNFENEYVSKLEQLNLDDIVIGIYQSVVSGDFISRSAIETFFQYQYHFSDSILLNYDPALTSQGQIGLRAYRIQPEIFNALGENSQRNQLTKNPSEMMTWEHESSIMKNKAVFNRIYVEIPVVVHNSPLTKILMHDISDKINIGNNLFFGSSDNSSVIDSNNPADIESNLKQLLSCLDTLHDCQYSYHRKLGIIQKTGTNEQKNRELTTNRLELALSSAQLNYQATSISQMVGQTVGKLMLSNAFYNSN